tara:strand:- start:3406 stop:4044 length:639 start_codon:yes stop_codon:yes gene_type:complete
MINIIKILVLITLLSCGESNSKKEEIKTQESKEIQADNNESLENTVTINYPTGEARYVQSYDIWGDLTGEWINYYKNGKIKQKGFYSNGKPYGNWRYYNEDGSLKKEEFIELDTNCVKFIALWSSEEIAKETGKTKKWVFLNYTVDVWDKNTSSKQKNVIAKLRASSYAEIIDVTEEDFKVKAPIGGKIGWINKSHVKSIVNKNRVTKELCN